jgi:hypothetical protein
MLMSNTAYVPSEHDEQVQLVSMFDVAYPEIKHLLYAIPNGGDRHPAVAVKLKEEGVRKGVPDLQLALPTQKYHGLYIEMKRRKGGRVSPEQTDMIDNLRKVGYRVEVCLGCDEAWQVITEYINGSAEKQTSAGQNKKKLPKGDKYVR